MKVLLIGDSIRLFYEEALRKELGDAYQVYSPAENCRFAAYAANSLRFWLNDFPKPDIIHFNAGLWDTGILFGENESFTPLDHYVFYMKRILKTLQTTGAKIIFATTTPTDENKRFESNPRFASQQNEIIKAYNQAVLEAFSGEDIVIDDLYAVINANKEGFISGDYIHPSKAGVNALAKAAAKCIRRVGKGLRPKADDSAIPKKASSSAVNQKTLQ